LKERVPFLGALESLVVGVKDWLVQGVLLGRLLPHQPGWWWWVAFGVGLLYLFIALTVPRPVEAGARMLEAQPVAAFFVGILGYILVNILFLILAATGVGVLAMPFLLIALLIIQLVGKASVYQVVGNRLGKQTGMTSLAQPLPAVLAGLVLFTLVYMVPVLGLLVWIITTPLAFGVALMAMFGALTAADRPGDSGGQTGPEGKLELGDEASLSSDAPLPAAGDSRPALPPVIGAAETSLSISAAEMASIPRAGFWVRLAATLLDLLIVGIPLLVLELGDYFLLPWVAYHVVMWTWRGTTIGGIVCRLKVVRSDGQSLNFAVALVRSLASILSALAFGLGFFWAGWTRDRLAWHDMIAGTTIVRVPQGTPLL
jgi:uncharacterized RDD family membrane protein YckC